MTFKREKILSPLRKNLSRQAHVLQILVGPRQVGKTTAIHKFLEGWPGKKFYATADQLTPPDTQWLAETWRQARKLHGKMPLLVVDEIQKVPRWSEAVKMLHDEDVREKRAHDVVAVTLYTIPRTYVKTRLLAGVQYARLRGFAREIISVCRRPECFGLPRPRSTRHRPEPHRH